MGKSMFLVIGVRGLGSSALTFPEDFELPCVYDTKESAVEEACRLNTENGVSNSHLLPDEDGECEDEPVDEDDEWKIVYEVWDVKDFSNKSSKQV